MELNAPMLETEKSGATGTKSIDQFKRQRIHAKQRGIEFNLTQEEWIDWWGNDIQNRGRGSDKLQMCRFEDSGPYELGNIYKGTQFQNIQERNKRHHKPHALTEAQKEEVLFYLRERMSTRKIATLFHVSQKTIMRVKGKSNGIEC